jgi:hypothetical protein
MGIGLVPHRITDRLAIRGGSAEYILAGVTIINITPVSHIKEGVARRARDVVGTGRVSP